jgi:hypothetical protein
MGIRIDVLVSSFVHASFFSYHSPLRVKKFAELPSLHSGLAFSRCIV